MPPSARIALTALLAALTAALYLPAAHFDFVDFDDFQYILFNPHVISGLSWDNAAWASTAVYASNWHPLTWLSHQADVSLFGRAAGGHHLVSVVLHVLNTVGLCFVLRRMTGAFPESLCVAALFAIHPLHVESVAYVAERKDVLSTLFLIAAMGAYERFVRQMSVAWYVSVVVLYALGLMTKPMLVTMPLLLLLCDVWPLGRRSGTAPASWTRLLVEKVPLFLLSGASCAITLVAQRRVGVVTGDGSQSLLANAASALCAYVAYLQHTIWPTALSPFYPLPESIHPGQVALCTGLLCIASTVAWRSRQRRPYLGMGWAWFVISLVPVAGFVRVGDQFMADRYTYVPLVGIFICAVWTVSDWAKNSATRRVVSAAGGALVTAVLFAATTAQLAHWRDGVALWQHAASIYRDVPLIRHNLGVALFNRGRDEEALEQYLWAIRLQPDYAQAYVNLGRTYFKRGEWRDAVQAYTAALALVPDDVDTRKALSIALTK